MGNVLVGDNGREMLLTPRSGSHSLAASWLMQREPENYAAWADNQSLHPALYLSQQITRGLEDMQGLGVIVRNPVERFRSICAKHPFRTVEDHLAAPQYAPIQAEKCGICFRFEDQLNAAAAWLGMSLPILHLDSIAEEEKPSLTAAQEATVRELYAADIAVWESLGKMLFVSAKSTAA